MLFIMRGTSCSGKDTFIKQYFPKQEHVLSSDFYRGVLTGDRGCQRENDKVFDLIKQILEIRLLNKVSWTVLNATSLRMRDCSFAVELCKKYHTPYTFISIQPPSLEELIRRSTARYHIDKDVLVPESVLQKHLDRYNDKNNIDNFIEEAANSKLCSFIEINQEYDVIRYID